MSRKRRAPRIDLESVFFHEKICDLFPTITKLVSLSQEEKLWNLFEIRKTLSDVLYWIDLTFWYIKNDNYDPLIEENGNFDKIIDDIQNFRISLDQDEYFLEFLADYNNHLKSIGEPKAFLNLIKHSIKFRELAVKSSSGPKFFEVAKKFYTESEEINTDEKSMVKDLEVMNNNAKSFVVMIELIEKTPYLYHRFNLIFEDQPSTIQNTNEFWKNQFEIPDSKLFVKSKLCDGHYFLMKAGLHIKELEQKIITFGQSGENKIKEVLLIYLPSELFGIIYQFLDDLKKETPADYLNELSKTIDFKGFHEKIKKKLTEK
jgi:hypothetical protein